MEERASRKYEFVRNLNVRFPGVPVQLSGIPRPNTGIDGSTEGSFALRL